MTKEFKQGDRVICFPGTEDECLAVVDGSAVSKQMAGMVRVIFDDGGVPGLVKPSEIAHVAQRSQSSRTLRDEFAMAALTGLIANSENCEQGMEPTISYLARTQNGSWLAQSAYAIADAMMEARK